ncbi:NADAR family protein [Spirosoma endophyticum]|uniref:NADAR domain-containing protein n=1 Tax=Spirosoma endophyticum TaxID=662367 RepID=A0A1I2BBD9_9BACT|nr:NADAR family protein [Spirosoma endophyticum]SFE53198.1 conserved hypothetical protein, ribA/ribD-fused [Spirosoma endophyticum]
METSRKHEGKLYYADECCVFRKTKELYGGLSNMASGFPLIVNGVHILSSEALYQACRFPDRLDIQEKIIKERSPMTAKMISKPFREHTRDEWDSIRIKIMRWCLRVKLAQNFIEFGRLLETTQDKPIVEDSKKDDFWGAIRDKENPNILYGVNALGRLLMELRQFYNQNRYSYEIFVVEPLNIANFDLYGHPILRIDERLKFLSFIKKHLCIDENNNNINIKNNTSVVNKKQAEAKVELNTINAVSEKSKKPKPKKNTNTNIKNKKIATNKTPQLFSDY